MSDQTTIETATVLDGDVGPAIGATLADRTHYAHTRYVVSDEPGVIWYDPRDGRENFATGRSGDGCDAVGDSVVTGCAIRPHRPTAHGDPAAEYVVKRHRTELVRRNADCEFRDTIVRQESYVQSVVCESLAAARAWCCEHIPGYEDAEWRDAVATRTDIEVTNDV